MMFLLNDADPPVVAMFRLENVTDEPPPDPVAVAPIKNRESFSVGILPTKFALKLPAPREENA